MVSPLRTGLTSVIRLGLALTLLGGASIPALPNPPPPSGPAPRELVFENVKFEFSTGFAKVRRCKGRVVYRKKLLHVVVTKKCGDLTRFNFAARVKPAFKPTRPRHEFSGRAAVNFGNEDLVVEVAGVVELVTGRGSTEFEIGATFSAESSGTSRTLVDPVIEGTLSGSTGSSPSESGLTGMWRGNLTLLAAGASEAATVVANMVQAGTRVTGTAVFGNDLNEADDYFNLVGSLVDSTLKLKANPNYSPFDGCSDHAIFLTFNVSGNTKKVTLESARGTICESQREGDEDLFVVTGGSGQLARKSKTPK